MSQLDEIVQNLALFKGLKGNTLAEIRPCCSLLTFQAGDTIVVQGEAPRNFYVLVDGVAEVILAGEGGTGEQTVLAVLGAGDYFGEMSLLTGEPTAAAIRVAEPCRVLVMTGEGFAKLVAILPELNQDLVRTLVGRLRRVNLGVWEARRKEAAMARYLQEDRADRYGIIVGKTAKRLQSQIAKSAASNDPVHLTGEIGSGKELVARSIHRAGERQKKPFIVISFDQLGNEADEKLFGRFGYLELAAGGTLLIKGVHLLEPDTVRRLVEYLEHPLADVRLITTSTHGLDEARPARLHDEFAGRLVKNTIALTPLRERKRDIPELIDYFLARYAKKYGRVVPTPTRDAFERLLAYDYHRANIAELEEVLERAFLLSHVDVIADEHVFLGGVAEKAGPGVNLLRLPGVEAFVKKGWFPGPFQAAVTAGFLLFLAWLLFGPRDAEANWAAIAAWSVAWPAVILGAALFGRVSCALCPYSGLAAAVQKRLRLERPVPGWLKKYDYLVVTFLFVTVLWLERMFDLRHSPLGTGVLLGAIALAAVGTAVVFQRHTWCRHVCPLGGMVGVCAMASPVELRSNPEVCQSKCNTHTCFKGTEEVDGCPLFQHGPFVDNNQACKLCLRCVRNCPNDSIQLRLRLPAREIWHTTRVNRGMLVFAVTFLAVLFPLVYFEARHPAMETAVWNLWFSAAFWGTAAAAVVLAYLFVRPRLTDEKHLPAIRAGYALVPLALGAHLAFQLQFLPVLPDLTVSVAQKTHGPGVELLSFGFLSPFVFAVLGVGLAVSLVSVWMVRATAGMPSRHALPVQVALTVACFVLVAWMLGGGV